MSYDFLYDVHDGVATLTFNRPEVLNALTFEVYAQFRNLLEELRYDEAVKVLVLTGQGRGFCSGGDVQEIIGELLKRDVKDHLDFTRMTGAVVQNMRLLDKPIIAALNGTTAGAGSGFGGGSWRDARSGLLQPSPPITTQRRMRSTPRSPNDSTSLPALASTA